MSQATSKTTTTTTEAPPVYDDEELLDEEQGEPDLTTTTEAPKKGGITIGRVRPFRSQESLIEALKRRRQQQGSGGHSSASTTTTSSPPTEKSSKAGRKPSSSNKVFSDQTGSDSQTKNTVNGRRFNPRGKSAGTARTEAPQEEVIEEEVQPTRSRAFGGRGRRF